MTATIQVLYPIIEGTTFDYDYYTTTHLDLVNQHLAPFLEGHEMVKGLAGGPDTPPDYYAIYTARCKDMATLQQALAAAGPVLADIPNYTDTQPVTLIGEVVG